MLGRWAYANRDAFTHADFDFFSQALGADSKRGSMVKLWEDPDALREMLDLKEIFRGILDRPSVISVSPDFYFYIIVRHAFIKSGISNPEIAEYVSRILAGKINACTGDPLKDLAGGFTHVSDFLTLISIAKGGLKFHLQLAAGNQFLVLTGLFPEFITKRHESCGAPDLAFYETFAQRAFRGAAETAQARGNAHVGLIRSLSEILPTARKSLNRVAEEFVFLGDS